MRKIFIIAGEQSGDMIGAKLIKSLRNEYDNLEIQGVGGTEMESVGLRSVFPMREISIMGFFEIITHIPNILRRIKQTLQAIEEFQPDIVVTIDSPGFCFKIAKKLQGKNTKLVHYVAPTVWAYKPKRAAKIAKLYDHLLLLFEFEKPYFDAVNLPSTFVGHHILEDNLTDGNAARFIAKYNIPDGNKILTILTGSRENEVAMLLPIFKDAIAIVRQEIPNLSLVFVSTVTMESIIKQQVNDLNDAIIISDKEDKIDAYAATSACLAKSGTGTLELSIAEVPLVIAYKINSFSAFLLKQMLKIKYVNFINIIAKREIIPEFLQSDCTANKIAPALIDLLKNDDKCKRQIEQSQHVIKQLSSADKPSKIAAQEILKLIN